MTKHLTQYQEQLVAAGYCMANDDDYCDWSDCPQVRDDEPKRSGRHCPRDNRGDESQ
jgi:hypothetical protein